MQIFRNLDHARLTGPSVLTIGTFDGLHRGHQDVLRQLKSAARQLHAQSVVIAFHPRPKAVFAPNRYHNDYLTTPAERIMLFENMGLDVLILVPFTLDLAQTSARDFMQAICPRLSLVQLCVGHDFALGKNREGNITRLRQLGQEFNYSVREIEPFQLDGQLVSSTQIRAHIEAGRVRPAAHLLGRYFSVTSPVVAGVQRGRTIGFPTANLAAPTERLLPANGVYATFITLNEVRYPSVTNVGIRPSFNGDGRTIEAHIFDFKCDIYGQTATLEFVEYVRPEIKFDNVAALVAQISHDAEQAKNLLTNENVVF